MKNDVSVCKFVQSILNVAEKGAKVARLIRSESALLELLIEEKPVISRNECFIEDFKTLGDVLIQEMVKHELGTEYSGISGNIFGEESNKFTNVLGETVYVRIKDTREETCLLLEKILCGNQHAAQLLSATVHEDLSLTMSDDLQQVDDTINVSNLAMWIDPIDGTYQYIKGDQGTEVWPGLVTGGLQNVLVLIGVYNKHTGQPVIGVINQPFASYENNRWIGSQTWGIKTDKLCLASPCLSTNPLVCHDGDKKPLILLSDVDSPLRSILGTDFDLLVVTSAGYKLMATAVGLCDAYIVTKPTTFKWDTCSPHAILRAHGGGIVDLNLCLDEMRNNGRVKDYSQLQMTYNVDILEGQACNSNGIIAYKNVDIVERICAILALTDI